MAAVANRNQREVGRLFIGPNSGSNGKTISSSHMIVPEVSRSLPNFSSRHGQESSPSQSSQVTYKCHELEFIAKPSSTVGFFRQKARNSSVDLSSPKPDAEALRSSPPQGRATVSEEEHLRELSRSLSEEWKAEKAKVFKRSSSFNRPKMGTNEGKILPPRGSLPGAPATVLGGVARLPPRPSHHGFSMQSAQSFGMESPPHSLSQISPPGTPPNPRFSPGRDKIPSSEFYHARNQPQFSGQVDVTSFSRSAVNTSAQIQHHHNPTNVLGSPSSSAPASSSFLQSAGPASSDSEVAALRSSVSSLESTVEGLVLTLRHLVKAQQIQSGARNQDFESIDRQLEAMDLLREEVRKVGEGFRLGMMETANLIRIKDEQQQARMFNLAGMEDSDWLTAVPTETGVVPSAFPATRLEFKNLTAEATQSLLQLYGLPLEPSGNRTERLARFLGFRR